MKCPFCGARIVQWLDFVDVPGGWAIVKKRRCERVEMQDRAREWKK